MCVCIRVSGVYTQVVVLGAEPCCNQTATLCRQPMFVALTSSGKLVAQLVCVCMTFYHLQSYSSS